jgi:hypothetical protein
MIDLRRAYPIVALATLLCTSCTSMKSSTSEAPKAKWTPLFNGKNLDGFSTYIDRVGKDNDPEGYFKVENGMIHILGLPPSTERKGFGYLATAQPYSDFHLRVQYKWGENKFVPRTNQPRDSGVLYLLHGNDKVWPNSIECQVQEGDTGEMIIVGNQVEATVPIHMRGNQRVFDPNGTPTPINQGRIYKTPSPDSRTDWNTVEIYVKGNSSVHMVNGVYMMRLDNIHLRSEGQPPLTSGRLALQAEGAEVWYRNVEIRPLAADEQLPAAPATQPVR